MATKTRTGQRATKGNLKKGLVKRRMAKKKSAKKKKAELKILGKSVLVEEDLRRRDHSMGLRAPRAGKGEIPVFYRKFAFRCGKCASEFKHTVEIPIIEEEVVCPECKKVHLIKIIPIGGHYEIKLPESIKEVRSSR